MERDYDEDGCPEDEEFDYDDPRPEDDCEPCQPDPKMKAVARLHAISRRMMMLASEYVKASFFALKPEKDGLRLRTYTP